MTYSQLADLVTATQEARRDALAIAVCQLQPMPAAFRDEQLHSARERPGCGVT
jgi:hypothetical protein